MDVEATTEQKIGGDERGIWYGGAENNKANKRCHMSGAHLGY